MSNISKINGLDISAADAQYVAAGNVDGPLGYNSVQSASTASYIDPTFISASAAASGFGSGGGAATSSWAINAITASLALGVSSSIVTDTSDYRVAMFAADNQALVRTSGTNISYTPNPGRLSVPHITATSLTGSLQGTASTSSYYISNGSTISSIGSGIEIQGSTRIFLTASNNINLAAPNGVNINTDAKLNSFVTMTALTSQSMNHVLTYNPTNGLVYFTASSAIGGGGGSTTSASFASTASFVNTLNQNVTINGNLTVFGTASYTLVSASQLNVGTNTISVNVFEPAQRFGGLVVYDSGSLSHQATASLFWDSLNNHWIYQNASGSTYSGGMLINGPRNLGALGDEQGTTNNAIMKGQGGDHITSSRIFDDGTNVYTTSDVQITGSLTVTGNVIATASWATNSITASYISGNAFTNANPALSASYALTASYALNGGGVTSITAGTGISIDQSTGNVTITNTGGSTSGTNLGLVYAVSLGYLMP